MAFESATRVSIPAQYLAEYARSEALALEAAALDAHRAWHRRMLARLRRPRAMSPQDRIDRIPELRSARDEVMRASLWRALR